MNTRDCVRFLQQALPRLGLQWSGYRRVHRLVCKRIGRRLAELGLPDVAAYRGHLDCYPDEWKRLEAMARIPVSRFYRDRAVFAALEHAVLPAIAESALAEGRRVLDCWSACCAGGEEAYTLLLLWQVRLAAAYPSLAMQVVATDADAGMLRRASAGCYAASSLKDLPDDLRQAGLEYRDGFHCVRPAFRKIALSQDDVRETAPGPLYDLILCRNAVLTYFDAPSREDVMRRVLARLRPGGALVIGLHEQLPAACTTGVAAWPDARAIYRKPAADSGLPLRCLAPHVEPVVAHGGLRSAWPPLAS